MKRFAMAMSVLVAAAGAAMGQAQMAGERQGGMHDMQGAKSPAEMKQTCEKAAQKMQAMKSECEQADRQLEQQVQKIQQAQGDAKTEAMASAIQMMAQQRKQMQEKSAEIMPMMMQHIQMHAAMAASDPQQGRQAMSQCPMMQASSDMARPAGEQMPGEMNR